MRNIVAVLFGVVLIAIGASAVSSAPVRTPSNNSPARIGGDDTDDTPEVTARVARISFLSGTARLRRSDGGDWEQAVLNVPLAEGDEVVTDADSRLEIQFAKDQQVRVGPNSYLKLVTLSDGGVAVSISLGSMSAHFGSLDNGFFEIDAPKTTIAAVTPGTYRVDAGSESDTSVRVAASGGAEARVYTETSGFTLKSDLSATVQVDGADAGDWQTTDELALIDDLDRWASGRDDAIAAQVKAGYYNKYYDDDMFGADDLDSNGEWIFMKDYGYVWRPFASAIASYTDWSPYRYGHWSWMPPFGWVWVNDEPWGWATYHYGRWFWADGAWNWSPYGYYHPNHSWWQAALVAVTVVDVDVCWYPLGYRQRHWDFNSDFWRRHHDDGSWDHGNAPTGGQQAKDHLIRVKGGHGEPPSPKDIPASAVIKVGTARFGDTGNWIERANSGIAARALTQKLDPAHGTALPDGTLTRNRGGMTVHPPQVDVAKLDSRSGAGTRHAGKPLDTELRKERTFGARTPRDAEPKKTSGDQPRQTGVFDRSPKEPAINDDTGTKPKKAYDGEKRREPPKPKDTEPADTGQKPTHLREPPKSEDKPASKLEPRSEPKSGGKSEPKSGERSEPKSGDKPATKSEPKSDSKPEPKSEPKTDTKTDKSPPPKKDGR